MFNSEKLFSKFLNRSAIVWQRGFSESPIQFSYADIIEASKIVEGALQEYINGQDNNIGVLLDHSAQIVPVILGILDSCSTFCCINPRQSSAELKEMINLLKCNIGLADKISSQTHFKEYEVLKEINIFNESLVVLNLSTVDFKSENISSYDDIFQSSKPMFCCSTSGTTGKPKMVQVPFKCLMPNVSSLSHHYKVTQSDVIYISSPPTFDPFVVDLCLGLFNGATILMVSNEIRLSAKELLSSIEMNSVTIIQITPSLFRRFSLEDIRNRLLTPSSSLRCLILGGEPFPSTEEVALWFTVNGKMEMHKRLFNIYGITEVSCWSTIYELTFTDISCKNLIPIGLPLDEFTKLKVVDCVNKELIQNGIGELFIESKIRKCVLSENGERDSDSGCIATGDLMEIRSGTIYYKTRVNNMVKIFGRKVNLTKIENTVKSHWSINGACCVYDKDENSLKLFIQRGNEQKYTRKDILQGLRDKLLEQEVPNEIYFVDEFPLSCHGKISKSKLLEMGKPQSCHYRDYMVMKLEENLPSFDAETSLKLSFLAAGGSSVLALQLVNELELKFRIAEPELITLLLNHEVTIDQILSRLQNCSPNIVSTNCEGTTSSVSCMWRHDLGKCIDSPPTIFNVDNKYIVSVGSHSHVLINVDLVSGQLLSKLTLPHRIECRVVQHNNNNNNGIVGCYDGFIYCFDIRNGTEQWKFNSHGMVKSRVCIIENYLVFGNYNSEFNLWCLTHNGAFVWKRKIGSKSIYAGVIRMTNTKIFVTTLDGVCAIVEPLTGKSLWETKLQSPIFSTPKITGSTLFVAEVLGIVHCIDYYVGKILCSFKANGNIYSSIESIDDNSICFGCYDKFIYCISYDNVASLFRLLWKVETCGQIFSSPKSFVFDSMKLVLVCSNNGSIYFMNASGELLTQLQIDGEIFSTPSVADNKVVIASRNNLLYCFDISQILKDFRYDFH